MDIAQVGELAGRVVANVERVVHGKTEAVEAAVIALLAGGHVIIEDYPGVGKTLLAKSLARSVDCRFTRIQFTPDLLPSDITGVNIFNQKTREFEFQPGPIFANIVLADEINRASPKTQSSLLECMQERQATVDTVTHPVEPPFMVIATQNPIEYEGTYPLPEAQLDRFMMHLSLGYPGPDEEVALLDEQTGVDPLAALGPVVGIDEVLAMAEAVRAVSATVSVRRYVVEILRETRKSADLYLGASPRAGVSLLRAAKARALVQGRDYVVPMDVKELAERVLAHRVLVSSEARLRGVDGDRAIAGVVGRVPVPLG